MAAQQGEVREDVALLSDQLLRQLLTHHRLDRCSRSGHAVLAIVTAVARTATATAVGCVNCGELEHWFWGAMAIKPYYREEGLR